MNYNESKNYLKYHIYNAHDLTIDEKIEALEGIDFLSELNMLSEAGKVLGDADIASYTKHRNKLKKMTGQYKAPVKKASAKAAIKGSAKASIKKPSLGKRIAYKLKSKVAKIAAKAKASKAGVAAKKAAPKVYKISKLTGKVI